MLIKLQMLYESLFLIYKLLFLILLAIGGALFGIGTLAAALLAITGDATLRDFSIAVFNLFHLAATMFVSLLFMWNGVIYVRVLRDTLVKGPLTRRQILILAGYTTTLLIATLILLYIINEGYEVAGSIVRYGLTAPGPGHHFVCELLYLCN